jgi:TRAP-type C4-dicarboxylate transport system substrate-binding protein
MRYLGKPLLACAAGLFFSMSAYAAETTLRVATWLPPTNPQNETVWPTWAKWVEEATEGRVNVIIENYNGHPRTLFTAVEDGIVDASFSVNAYLSGRCMLPGIAEIPGEVGDAESGSVALWQVYKEYFEPANEYEGLQVLGMFVHGPGQLHTRFPVQSLNDLKGRKMRIGGGQVSVLAERMEVSPVGAPAPKSYEMMQQGVVDGTFLPPLDQKFLRIHEVSSQLTLFPTGLYNTAFTIFMNPDVFEQLSSEDQAAIMSVSGERLSRLAGQAWGAADQDGIDEATRNGVDVVAVSANDRLALELKELSRGLDQLWVESVAVRNIDAAGALQRFRDILEQEQTR